MASAPSPFPGDPQITPELVRSHKLSEAEHATIVARLGRPPTYAELGVLSVMWSEHCSYKSSRVHLARLPDQGPAGHPGPGGERRRRRHRRRLRGGVQDGVAQPPLVHRALPGRGDGRGRHPPRRLHHGRAPHRQPRLAALRPPRSPAHAGAAPGRGRRRRRLRQLHRRAHRGRRALLRPGLRRQRPRQRLHLRRGAHRSHLLRAGERRGQPGDLRRRAAPAATASTAPPWPRTSSRRAVPASGPRCRSAIRSWRSSCWRRAWRSSRRTSWSASRTWARRASRRPRWRWRGAAGAGSTWTSTAIPRRAKRLAPYEMLLSESQERMLLVAQPGKEPRVMEICKKWELDAAIIGHVTDTGRWVIRATPGYDPARRRAGRAGPGGRLRSAGRLPHRRRSQVRSPAARRRRAAGAPRLRSGHHRRSGVVERGAPRARGLAQPGLAALGVAAVRSHRPRRHATCDPAATPPWCASRASATA